MEYKFDAFISYRHAEVDSAVAKDIQHWLEHFHVPKAIQKTSGKKKINRVFRDKEELPLSMNLGETITDALIHSEYLIVICSPRTKESQWVQREIEAFLETHDLEHILVVIAEGEPDDVIPKILTYKETTSVNENGEEITVKEDLEPLGCDYRVGKRKAHKEELPRLAASLLNCSYDDLIQRARQYRTRVISGILATVLALALGILGYVLYSNQKIKTNYENSLRAQSEYLASESLKSFDNKDRSTAIALALEALPSETNDRPYVAKAEYALANAIIAYNPISNTDPMPIRTFNMNGPVVDLCSNEGPYVTVLDRTGLITIIDTKKNRIVNGIQTHDYYSANHSCLVGITSKNSLIICEESPTNPMTCSLTCYSLPDCKMIWKIKSIDNIHSNDVKLINDSLYYFNSDGRYNYSLHQISIDSGKEEKIYPIPSNHEDLPLVDFVGTVFDDYLPFLVLAYKGDDSAYTTYIPAVLNLQTGEVMYYPQNSSLRVEKVAVTKSGDLLILSTTNDINHSFYLRRQYMGEPLEDRYLSYKTKQTICCIDMNTREKKWEVKDTSEDYELFWDLSNILFDNKTSTTNAVMAVFSNKILIIDAETGEILKSVETPGSIASSHTDVKGTHFFTREGYLYYLPFNNNDAHEGIANPICPYRVEVSWINHGVWVPKGHSIIRFTIGIEEGSWKPIDFENPNNLSSEYTRDCLFDDNIIAFLYDSGLLYSNGSLSQKMKYIDLQQQLKDIDKCDFIIGQLSNNHILVSCSLKSSLDHQLIEIDPKTESAQPVVIPEMEINPWDKDKCQLIGDTFYNLSYYQFNKDPNTYFVLSRYDFKNKKLDLFNLGKDSLDISSLSISPDQSVVLISSRTSDKRKSYLRFVNLSEGKSVDVDTDNLLTSSDLAFSWHISDNHPTLFAIGDQHSVSIWDETGKRIARMSEFEGPVLDVSFVEDGSLYVVTTNNGTNGKLLHYSKDYSTVLSRTDIPIGLAASSDNTKWHFIEGNLLLFKTNKTMSIIDLEQNQLLAIVQACEGYQASSDSFICIEPAANDGHLIGYRKRYTTDTLISAAKKQLGDFKLSDTQRAEYGLKQ